MSEYRTPEEDTIGGQPAAEDDLEKSGPSPESGDEPAPDDEETS